MANPITYEGLDALMAAMAYYKDEEPPLVGIAVSEELYSQIEREVVAQTAIPFNGILLGLSIKKRKELNGSKREWWPIYAVAPLSLGDIPLPKR